MGTIFRGGTTYSNNGLGSNAVDVAFSAGLSGMTSTNVNDAILELAEIVNNAVGQFASHAYEYVSTSGKTKMDFFKECLTTSSRAPGGFHLFSLKIANDKNYIGLTITAGTKCSFTLHSIENPEVIYYGHFDNMVTGNSNSFEMYNVSTDGTDLFAKPDFTI